MVVRVVVIALIFCTIGVYAADHTDGPRNEGNPITDILDFYMFRSYEPGRANRVVLAMTFDNQHKSGVAPSGDHFYEMHLDTDGDAIPDFTYSFVFETTLGGAPADHQKVVINPDGSYSIEDVPASEGVPAGIEVTTKSGDSIPAPLKVVAQANAFPQAQNQFVRYLFSVNDNPATNLQDGSDFFDTPHDYTGENVFDNAGVNYDAYSNSFIFEADLPNCPGSEPARVFAGERADPFYATIGKIFDLINFVPIPGADGEIEECPKNNDQEKKNVWAIALEIPISCLDLNNTDDGIIGGWATTSILREISGQHVKFDQISRTGSPLYQILFNGARNQGIFNLVSPSEDQDFPEFTSVLRHPVVPVVVDQIFAAGDMATVPNEPREDLYALYFTGLQGLNQWTPNGARVDSEQLRLDLDVSPTAVGSQSQFGPLEGDDAGYPNGRRPADDVVDILLRFVEGAWCFEDVGVYCSPSDAPLGAVKLHDGETRTSSDYRATFPFMNSPAPGGVNEDFCAVDAPVVTTDCFASRSALLEKLQARKKRSRNTRRRAPAEEQW